MTQSDRDVSAHRVNLNVIQAVPNHLEPSTCASPFIPDKAITPVNKYGLVLVIMQRTGGILWWQRQRWMCQPRCFSDISLQQRGAFSPAPWFYTSGISADPPGNQTGLWLHLQHEISRAKWHLTICWMEASLYLLWYENTIHFNCSLFHLVDTAHRNSICFSHRKGASLTGLPQLLIVTDSDTLWDNG